MSGFSVPAVDPALRDAFEARPRQAGAWLANLPFASPPDAAYLLLNALRAMNRSALDGAARDALLALYRPAIARVSAGLERLLGDAGVPPHAQPRLHAALLCELACEHAIGYGHLLQPDGAVRPAQHARRTAEAAAQLSAALRDALIAYALAYRPAPPGLWRELHRLHALTRQGGSAAGGDAPPADQSYREALLLALADPPHMSRGELLHARAYVRAYAPLATLRAGGPASRAGFAVDPDSDRGAGLSETADAALRLDTGMLCRRLHDTALRLRTGDTPRSLGLPDDMSGELALRVAKRLSRRWRSSAERAYPRRPGGTDPVEIVAGVSAIHRLLAEAADGEATDDEDAAADDTLPVGEAGLLAAPAPAVRISRWAAYNDSAVGLALSGAPDAPLNLRIGDALALRVGAQPWSLAVIRWLVLRDGSRVELGIERLAPALEPVWVRPMRGHRTRPEPALFVPGLRALRQPDRLLLPRFLYAPGMDAEIVRAGRLHTLSFGRCHAHTPNFDLIDFTLLA